MPPLPKPPTCSGCPFASRGRYWVPDRYVPGADVLILSQNPGQDEEAGRRLVAYSGPKSRVYEPCEPQPLTGATGYDLERKYLPLAGLDRDKVSLANPIRCRLEGANDLPKIAERVAQQAVQHCQHHHYRPPEGTRLIVAEGAYALYAATGEDGSDSPGHKISRSIEGWRGWAMAWNPPPRPQVIHTDVWGPGGIVVLPTFHLASLYRSPWYTPVSQRDWSKIPAVLRRTWPEPFPEIQAAPPRIWPQRAAFDTEYDPTGRLVRYSLATRNRQGLGTVWVVEAGAHEIPVDVPSPLVTVFHHVEADLAYLQEILGAHEVELKLEDTMYLHACLHADLDHDLDFLGSLYARTNRWKHLLRTNPRVYAGGDALGTWDSWVPMSRELERDPQVERVYREYQLPLAPIIHKARTHGLRVIPERVEAALQSMEARQRAEGLKAQAHAGWPLNIGSASQVSKELYQVEGVQYLGKRLGKAAERLREEGR